MDREDRMKLIEKIEAKRKSQLVVYVTSDRRGMETQIGKDIFPILHEHLTKFDSQNRIDLFLYSLGGDTVAGYALVNLFREFCDEFNVIVPFRALSCATLISLGANEVVMTKMGQLGPIDPSVNHPLAPYVKLPDGEGLVSVNVEDVNAFINLAKKEFGLSAEDMRYAFEKLSSSINPLVLGAVQRSRELIAFLASNLMREHIQDEARIAETVNTLTRERFSHDYIISKKEARDVLKLNIVEPDDGLTSDIVDLWGAYKELLKLDVPAYIESSLSSEEESKVVDFNRAIIESSGLTHVFRTKTLIRREALAKEGDSVTGEAEPKQRTIDERWVQDNSI